MKKRRLKRIIAYIIMFFIVISYMQEVGFKNVDARGEVRIKISDYLDKEGETITIDSAKVPDFMGSCIIEIDEDASFEGIYVDGDVTFEGSNELSVEWLYSKGKMTLKSGTNISVECVDSFSAVYSGGVFDALEGANLNVDYTWIEDEDNGGASAIESPSDIYIDGANLNIKSNVRGIANSIDSEGMIQLVNGNVTAESGGAAIASMGDVRIIGSVINAVTDSYSIWANGEIVTNIATLNLESKRLIAMFGTNISLYYSNVKVKGINCALYTDYGKIEIYDSYVESIISIGSSESFANKYNLTGTRGIDLEYGSAIVEPSDAVIKKLNSGEYVVANKDGSNPTKVVIDEKPEPTPAPTPAPTPTPTPEPKKPEYSNEWVNGKWYDADGKQTYAGTLQWKNNATGWWVEDTSGWYPANQWQKIDGVWYFFKPDGYMASNEYYNGYWFNSDGSWDSQYLLSWKSNSTGWWVEDISGWWPSSSWLKIDGYWYYFDASGYMVSNCYIDGWWISADGVCY